MEKIIHKEFTIFEDRGWKKQRINICTRNFIIGGIKPVARL